MPTHPEAVRLNLEYYRKQAKALLKAALSGDSVALQRLAPHSSPDSPRPALHDAQLTIAREQGFPSWPRFKDFIVQSRLDFQGLVTAFLDAALADVKRAEELLGAHPELSGAGFYCALVLGEASAVVRAIEDDPGRAVAKGGPRDWQPILYVCFSRFAEGRSSRAAGFAETARLLLRHGADPNAFYMPEEWPDNPLPCLYGATGLNNNPALARALLEAGARPNDTESLYHSTEHPDLACVRLLLEFGASPEGTNALKHTLDRENLEGLRLLLAARADPNHANDLGETALHWAVLRGRSPEAIAALVDHGANIDARRKDGRTAYALAMQAGQRESAALLAGRGANTELPAVDAFVSASMAAGPAELDRLLTAPPEIAATPENCHLVPDLASRHATSAVRALLAAGLPVDSRGEWGATALHWACWKGYADLVELLIQHRASFTIEDHQYHGTPPGWFGHGLRNCGEPGGDRPQVARLLLAAGASIPPADIPTGDPAVDAVLREYHLID